MILKHVHRGFLERWNAKKVFVIFDNVFHVYLMKGFQKYGDFLNYLQNSTANSTHLAAHFCTALVCPQEATVRIQFLPNFWNPFIK